MFKKILALFDPDDRLRLGGVFVMMLLASMFEMAGIGLIFPVLKVAADPNGLDDYQLFQWLVGITGPLTQAKLLVYSMGVLLVAYVFKGAFLLLQRYTLFDFLFSRQVRLSSRIFDRYLHMPYRYHIDQHTSSILRTVNEDVLYVFQSVLVPLSTLLIEVFLVMLLMLFLISIEPLGSILVMVLIGVFSAIFLRALRRRTYVLGQERYTSSRQMIKWVQQGIHGIKQSKVLGRVGYFQRAYHQACGDFADVAKRQSVYASSALPFIEVIGVGSMVVMAGVMVYTGSSVEQILPILGLFGVAASRLMPSANRMLISITSIRGYWHILDKLVGELDTFDASSIPTLEETHVTPTPTWKALTLSDLRFAYTEDAPILRGLELELKMGEMVGFVGSSGSGKSTLMHILLGLLEAQSGSIKLDGMEHDLMTQSWRSQFGFISQETYLCDDTIRNNVAFGLPEAEIEDDRLWEVLELANIADHIRGMPEGLATMVGEAGMKLSGGQKQRLGIARALYHDPSILIMDEATSSLDNQTEREISESIEALSHQNTLWIVAHRLTTVQNCDRIVFLDQGKVLMQGTYDELLEGCAPFKKLVYAWDKKES